MRILYVTNSLDVGGIETNLILLSRTMGERGHAVTVATSGGALVDEVLATGASHHEIPITASLRTGLAAARQLRDLIRDEVPDVVHVFSAPAAVLARIAVTGLRPRPRMVASIMGLVNAPDEASWKTHLRVRVTAFGADRVIVIAPAIGKALDRVRVRRARRIELPVVGVEVPESPASVSDIERIREAAGAATGQYLVTTIGDLVPRKSHDLFVEAAGMVGARRDDVRFAIVGGGPLRSELHALVESTGAPVALLGERRDVSTVLAATDLCVRPGVVEGFVGITVLEAQALAVPVIAFETEDVKLAVEHGRTGWLVRNGEVEALASAISELLDDAPLRARLAAQGRASVMARFEIGAVADRLARLYEDGGS